ncbi:MAG: hypothetical protein CMK59_07150 [Proteobacteria bacterium]|nr:hypothetical protein [Pseudomonadota bacterium]
MTQNNQTHNKEPSLVQWGIGVAAAAGLTGMLCCVAPMVLFMLGLMGGTYAISFADFFYMEDGSIGIGAWILRALAVLIGLLGIWRYHSKETQCSIDPKRQQKNLILLIVVISLLGVGFFLSLEALSSWYFDAYIVPAQQEELGLK